MHFEKYRNWSFCKRIFSLILSRRVKLRMIIPIAAFLSLIDGGGSGDTRRFSYLLLDMRPFSSSLISIRWSFGTHLFLCIARASKVRGARTIKYGIWRFIKCPTVSCVMNEWWLMWPMIECINSQIEIDRCVLLSWMIFAGAFRSTAVICLKSKDSTNDCFVVSVLFVRFMQNTAVAHTVYTTWINTNQDNYWFDCHWTKWTKE